MGNLDFNVEPPSENESQGTYEDKLVPDGTYKVEVSETDFTPNSIGTGSYLRVDYTVLEGEHANEEFVEFFNIKHKNPPRSGPRKSSQNSAEPSAFMARWKTLRISMAWSSWWISRSKSVKKTA